jgi:hypothetical protein
MDKKIILAGAAGAMAIAGAAIAQTTAQDQNANPNMPANSATPYNQNSDTTTSSTANTPANTRATDQTDRSATTASQYGQESAARSADQSAVNTAGERG